MAERVDALRGGVVRAGGDAVGQHEDRVRGTQHGHGHGGGHARYEAERSVPARPAVGQQEEVEHSRDEDRQRACEASEDAQPQPGDLGEPPHLEPMVGHLLQGELPLDPRSRVACGDGLGAQLEVPVVPLAPPRDDAARRHEHEQCRQEGRPG